MKKILLITVVMLGVAMWAGTASAITPIHEAQYLWFYNGENGTTGTAYGTLIDQLLPVNTEWTVGDTSGETIAQVREKFWVDEGLGYFSWTLWNDDITNLIIPASGITSLHILSAGFEPLAWTVPYAGTAFAWDFEHDGDYYIWSANGENILSVLEGTSLGGFGVVVPTTYYAIGPGAIDYDGNEFDDGDSLWYVSHPSTPEPSSMLLLGMGLMGIAGRTIKKKVRA